MAVCEFHDKYADHLIDEIAIKFVGKKGTYNKEWEEIFCVFKNIALCKVLEQISPAEADNLASVIFKLYPQHEEKIKEELALQFGWV